MYARIVLLMLMLSCISTVSAARSETSGSIPARPVLITRCDAPVEFSDRHQYVGLSVTSATTFDTTLQLTLIRQADQSYEVLAGADSVGKTENLISMQGEDNPVHLVLNTDSGMEHFLFVLSPGGSGELLWSSATASALTTCTAST